MGQSKSILVDLHKCQKKKSKGEHEIVKVLWSNTTQWENVLNIYLNF